jgi:hypothetical protein
LEIALHYSNCLEGGQNDDIALLYMAPAGESCPVPSLAKNAVDWLNIQSCYTSIFEALDNSQNNPILASEDVCATKFSLLSINPHKPP